MTEITRIATGALAQVLLTLRIGAVSEGRLVQV